MDQGILHEKTSAVDMDYSLTRGLIIGHSNLVQVAELGSSIHCNIAMALLSPRTPNDHQNKFHRHPLIERI